MKNFKQWGVRLGLLVLGSLFMSLGSQLAVPSRLGADVIVLVWEGLQGAFGWSLGQSNLVLSLVFLALTFFINRRYIGIGTVLGTLLQSWMLTWFSFEAIGHQAFWIRVLWMVIGICLISIGCAFFALASLGVGPYIGLVLSLHQRLKLSLAQMKFRLDALCVVLAILLGTWPSLGPVLSLVISGPIMDWTMKVLQGAFPRLFHYETAKEVQV